MAALPANIRHAMNPSMKFGAILFPVALAASMPADAAEFPATALLSMGFREAQLSDFSETAETKMRVAAPDGYLKVTADFNGDGKLDEARLLVNDARRIAYVAATILTSEKLDTYVLASYPLEEIGGVAIRAAKPAPVGNAAARHAGIEILDLTTGEGEANYFDGEEFAIRLSGPR